MDENITATTTTLLVKLNKLTSTGKLVWRVEDPPKSLSKATDDYIPFFMAATYKGQKFGLYQQRYQSFDGERERLYWSERVALAILDYEGRVLWEITSYNSALHDLFDSARRQVSNVDGILKELLSDDDDEDL